MRKHDFNEVVDRKNTYSSQWDFIADRFGREDIVPFSVSDMDFRTPDEIRERLVEIADYGIYGYTRWKHEDYENSIINYFGRRHGLDISDKYIAYSPSVLCSIAVVFELISKKGDWVSSFGPMYDSFFKLIENNDRRLNLMTLNYESGRFTLDFDEFERQMEKTKIFLLCSPHNPIGRIWKKDELDRMVAICKKHGVWIISDEIHSDIIHKGKFVSSMDRDFSYDKIVLVSSASKTFNTPALIGSYAIFKDENLSESFNKIVKTKYFVGSASWMGIEALMTGYNKCDYFIDDLNDYIYDNYLYMKKSLETLSNKIEVTELEATYLMWVRMDQLADTKILSDTFIKVGKIGIMSGENYGDDRFFRINIGCPRKKLELCLGGIEKSLKSLELI